MERGKYKRTPEIRKKISSIMAGKKRKLRGTNFVKRVFSIEKSLSEELNIKVEPGFRSSVANNGLRKELKKL